MTPNWSNSCKRINKCSEENCFCYNDYLMWTHDYPRLEFEEWKELILIERETNQ